MQINDVSQLLKVSRTMVEQLNHVKKEDDSLTDIKTLVFAILVTYYGSEHFDEVYMAFLKANFIECRDLVRYVSIKYSLPEDVVLKLVNHCPGTVYASDATNGLKKGHFKFTRNIYVSTSTPMPVLVNSVIHQMNHIISSLHQPVLKKKGSYVARMGLCVEYFDSRKTEVLGLEEAINGLQVVDMVRSTEKFADDLPHDDVIASICRELDPSYTLSLATNNIITDIVEPLYKDDAFRGVLVNSRLNGNLKDISLAFTSTLDSSDSYNRFLQECNNIEKAANNNADYSKEEAKTLVKTYVDSVNK